MDQKREKKIPKQNAGKRAKTAAVRSASAAKIPVVGIGASAGGLAAFLDLLRNLPKDTGMAFVLVQHLDPEHESALTEILSRATSLPVQDATNGVELQANHVYIIPPDKRLTVRRGKLKVEPRGQTPGAQHSIDAFLESLAQDQQERAIGVILSGTASDGTLGLEAIKAEGGVTFAQDGSAKYDSMPRNAVSAGCVDYVLAPAAIAAELTRIAKHPHVAGGSVIPARKAADDREVMEVAGAKPATDGETGGWAEDGDLRKILLLVRNHRGVDFSLYKPSTMQRRIARRMVLGKCETPAAYAAYLRGNDKELEGLYSDLLISVTSFFRNPEAFAALKRVVFPKLLERRGADGAVRVWVAGCSTGQEVYSVAMAYHEFCDRRARAPELQIFGTDLNEAVLERARQGYYPASLAEQVSPERLRRFFVEEEGGYRITKALREVCVFARHNVLSDPPFSRLDLISCRNLLIYIEAGLQQKILPTFHYALNPNGFLLLGASESAGASGELFEAVDKKVRLFRRVPGVTPAMGLPASSSRSAGTQRSPATGKKPDGKSGEANVLREADRVIANRFSPPGVVVDSNLRIVQSRGDTEPFLRLAAGRPSLEVLKMARGDLMLPLRAAINKARKDGKTVRRENVEFSHDGDGRKVSLEVIPLKNLKEQYYLIFFREDSGALGGGNAEPETSVTPVCSYARHSEASRLRRTEHELAETREYLQSVQEQFEAANEELQVSNEEVTSANEELQSMNEELETSKEELESSNEELTTVNEELVNRNRELGLINSDLNNLQASIATPVLVLSRDLKIRRFTPVAEKVFNLMASDAGRALSSIRHNLDFPGLEEFISESIRTLSPGEREVRDLGGRWHMLRVRPYLTAEHQVDGAVVVLVDVNALKETEGKIRMALDFAEAVIQSVPPLVVLESDLRVRRANEAFYRTFKVASGQTEGRLIYELGNGQWNIPALRTLFAEILPERRVFTDYEVTHDFESIGRRTILLSGRQVESMRAIVLSIEDITERVHKEEALRQSEQRFRSLVTASSEVLYRISPDWSETRQLEGVEFVPDSDVSRRTWVEAFIPAEAQREVTAAIKEAIEGKKTFELEHRVTRADGSLGWAFSRAIPLLDAQGEIAEWFGALTDITERKDAEVVLKRSKEELEKLVAERTAKLQELVGELEHFSYSITHDMRAPLRSMQGFAEILAEQCGGCQADEAKGFLERIRSAASRMDSLITDALNFSKTVRRELPLLVVDTGALLRGMLDSYPEFQPAKARIEIVGTLPRVMGNEGGLTQCFSNLLGNAVKFVEPGQKPEIRIWAELLGDRADGDGGRAESGAENRVREGTTKGELKWVRIWIEDKGIGIPREAQARVFDMFRRANKNYDGTGIGLALVRKVAERMGGRVGVESEEGKGSRFWLELRNVGWP